MLAAADRRSGMARARHGSYLFRRDGSANWWVRLRSGNRRIEKSLRTSDRREAEILAVPMVAAHKATLLAARPRLEMTPYTLDPGEHIGPNGERVIATTRELIYLDAAGALIKTEPNGPARRLVNVPVGKKTEQSLRRVPLPACVLPYLPKIIKGRLFVTKHLDPPDMASKRLGKFLDDIGITDPRKVVHSLRHRAQDRLRAAECPEDIRWAILGHEERTVAAGYGEGFSLPVLRKWIDKIGF
jgi:hypothetical protein